MTQTARATGFTQEAFEAFLAGRHEPDWLTELRTSAWKTFTELPMPDRRAEEWMRTDIRLFRLDSVLCFRRLPAQRSGCARFLSQGTAAGPAHDDELTLKVLPVQQRPAVGLASLCVHALPVPSVSTGTPARPTAQQGGGVRPAPT